MAAGVLGRLGRILAVSVQTLGWLLGGGAIAVLVGFIWLTTTPSGSRWAITQATTAVAGLSVKTVQGSLMSGLELGDIQYHDATGLAVHLKTASLHLDWRQLWLGRLQVNQLGLHTGQITLPAAPPTCSSAASPPINLADLPLRLPIALRVKVLDVTDVTLIQAVALPVAGDGAHAQSLADVNHTPPLSYHLTAMQARGTLNGDLLTVQLQSAQARLPQAIHAELSGTLTVGTAAPHQVGGAVQSIVALPQGWLSSEIQLGGSLAELSLALASRWDGFSTPSAALTAKARLTLERLELTSLNLDTLGGSLCSTGTVNYADGLALALHGRASALNPAQLSPAAEGRLGFDYQLNYSEPEASPEASPKAEGDAALKITPSPQMTLKLSQLSGTIAATPFNNLTVEAKLANQALSGAILGGQVAGGTLQAQLQYGLTGNKPIKLSVEVAAVSLNAALSQLSAKPAQGALTATLALDGALGADVPQDTALKFSLSVPKATLGLITAAPNSPSKNPLDPLAISAHIEGSVANQRLILAPSTLELADAHLRAQGQWGWQPNSPATEISLDLTVPELSRLPWGAFGLPPVSGRVQMNTRLSGRINAPVGTLDLSVRHLAFERWQLSQLKAQGQLGGNLTATALAGGTWPIKLDVQANDLTAASPDTNPPTRQKIEPPQRWLNALNLRFNGTLPTPQALSAATGAASIKTSQTLSLSAQSPHGKLTLAAKGSGQGQDWRGVISQLDLTALAFKQHALGSWRLSQPVALGVSPSKQQLAEACLIGQGDSQAAPARLCFAGLHAGEQLQGQVSFDSPLATVLGLAAPWLPAGLLDVPNLSKAVPGRLILAANGGLKAGKPFGTLKLTLPDSRFSLPQLADGTVFSYQKLGLDAALTADSLNLHFFGDSPQLFNGEGRGTIGLAGDHALDVATQIRLPNLSAFAFLVPQLSPLTGEAQATLQLGGTLSAPKPSGTLKISQLAFALPDTGVGYDQGEIKGAIDAAGQLTFDGQLRGILSDEPSKSAAAPDRQLRVQGTGDLAHLPRWQVSARIQGNDVPVLRIPSMRVDASPDVTILATQAGAQISGTVQLPLVDARIEKLPEGVVKSSDDLVIVGAKAEPIAAGYPLTGDIKLSLGDAVTLTGMGFSTGLSGALDLRLRPQKPLAAFGEIDLKNGKYKAYGQDLSISQGRLLFVGPLDDPGLSVTAQRTIDSNTVGLKLGGTLYHPKTTVFSSPAIPESDALSLLLTGRRLNDGTAADGSVLLNAVTSLGIAQGDDILRDVGQKFGFDSLGLDTTGGLTGTRLSVGKKIGDRLLVRYAIGVLTGVGQIITEYQLNKYFSIEITSSPVATGGDVIYRIR
ncbi:MAG TPA: translocation/assembly module TamB domain-containing protein [Halothiobacillus sp.]|nr:translocation/assembly module TamB domain-containing protein [Halothiobacillus sp.]